MNILNEKKGFTLIELLAVIVILAIITVIGVTTVLPYLQGSAKNAFAIEANNAVDAASQAMSLYQIGSINIPAANITEPATANDPTVYCFTLKQLVDYGLWTKDASTVDTGGDYAGTVLVSKAAGSNAYTYSVSMHSKDYYVKEKTGNVTSNDIHDYPTAAADITALGLKVAC